MSSFCIRRVILLRLVSYSLGSLPTLPTLPTRSRSVGKCQELWELWECHVTSTRAYDLDTCAR
jgi:hypothetical protein